MEILNQTEREMEMPATQKKPLSPSQSARRAKIAARLYRDGYSLREVAAAIGYSVKTTVAVLKSARVKTRGPGPRVKNERHGTPPRSAIAFARKFILGE
jgi:DNA-binding CsgD family transcriptional regulator